MSKEEIAKKIKQVMEAQNLTFKELSYKSGLSLSVCYTIVNGLNSARLDTYNKVCNGLGVTLKEFL